ncbi:MAG: zinc ribbon domain-containing protein [Candidatus Thermoplasmatota archaeon]|jgi:ribosomal protein L32|nr:zinc ribbon domain-containing protein [Candidatus Thermoplasmatota archaeon]MCL5790373.1 zinc ribbon domain-containing protein [Candidatus Thermoplasmatota archaeon]
MIVLDPDENEILQEKSVMIQNGAKVENGVLHITNKRILYEKQGERKLRRADASRIFLEIPMYEIVNVASAVPKMSLMTKKKLSVEYRDNGDMKVVEFEIKHPETLVDTIKNWATTSKREHEDRMKSEDQERFRREVELAKAKATKSNVNMINLGTGTQRKDIQTDQGKSNMPKKVDTIEVCPECGEVIPENSKFCPHCGYKIHD